MAWYHAYSGPVPTDNPVHVTSFAEIAEAVTWYRDFFREQDHPLGYFAALYAKVSMEIEAHWNEGKFKNPAMFERMDVNFVGRYLQAMDAYLHGKETTQVWKIAILGCEQRTPTVLQHLLAALNAHVGLDLPAASAVAAPGALIHDFQEDFETINNILFGLMEQVQADLGQVQWPIRVWNLLLGKLDDHMLKVGLFGARALAWRQAVQLAEAKPSDHARLMQALDTRFSDVGRAIIHPKRWWVRLGLRWVRRTEKGTVAENIGYLID